MHAESINSVTWSLYQKIMFSGSGCFPVSLIYDHSTLFKLGNMTSYHSVPWWLLDEIPTLMTLSQVLYYWGWVGGSVNPFNPLRLDATWVCNCLLEEVDICMLLDNATSATPKACYLIGRQIIIIASFCTSGFLVIPFHKLVKSYGAVFKNCSHTI